MAVQQIMEMKPGQNGTAGEPERIIHSDESAKWWILGSVFFLVIFGIFGLITAIKFVFPGLFNGVDWLSWPRIRPAHVNGVVFGWLVPVSFGLYSYIIPRLTGARLYSESLSKWMCVIWFIAVIWATLFILNPWNTLNPWLMTKGKEWQDYDVVSNFVLAIAATGMCYNLFRTIAARRYQQIYVTMWYGMGFMLWTLFSYIIGNWPGQALDATLFPVSAAHQFPYNFPYIGAAAHQFGFVGANDAVINWFYGHAVVGLVATPGFLGIGYYFIPKALNAPLYNHKLSILGFWSIAIIYVWNGAHHMIYGPIPYWLQTVATIFSFLLFIPVIASVGNFIGTMWGEWHQLRWNVPFKFLASGTIMYFLVSAQGSFEASRPVSALTHFTDFTVGHSHLALFGFATMFAYAGLYYAVPRMFKRPLYSESIAEVSFWFAFIGITVYVVALSIAGCYQGYLWNDPNIPFIVTVQKMIPFWHARASGGAMMVISMILVAFNVYKTATVLYNAPLREEADGTVAATDLAITAR
jgi:cytochrome c oxidase cbb3-type subunit 1